MGNGAAVVVVVVADTAGGGAVIEMVHREWVVMHLHDSQVG